jgi:UDP-2-acetamido-2-deoxy-ribo-hexuluronate aminotransferase
LGCYGDGGAIFTSDDVLAQACREIRIHGQSARYTHTRIGVGGRMDTLQCAVLLAKLDRFEWEIGQRKTIGSRYQTMLTGVEGVRTLATRPDRDCVWGQYTVRVEHRDELAEALQLQGIPTAVHYPKPLHLQPIYATGSFPNAFPNSVAAAQSVLSLPFGPYLTELDQQRVARTIAASGA